MSHVAAILSMLHERADVNSATRLFRGQPVLDWTLRRLAGATGIGSIAVLCWDDQARAAQALASRRGAHVLAKGPRAAIPAMQAVAAARRWVDGWRGGLLGACDFDLGFHGPWVKEIADRLASSAVLLVDPSAGLVDPHLLDGLIAHARAREGCEFCFSQAAPGLSGVLLEKALVDKLAKASVHPGKFLHYIPDQPGRDPISNDNCAPVPTPVARTLHRFRLDSERQIRRIESATVSLNGQLVETGAEDLVGRLAAHQEPDLMPREVTLELNTRRATCPIFWPGRYLDIQRSPMALSQIDRVLRELAAGAGDDLRLTLGGVGDPLLAGHVFEVIETASQAGIAAIHLQTDLLEVDEKQLARLLASPLDILSIHLPATTAATYQAIMGIDGLQRVLANTRLLVQEHNRRQTGVPLVVPVFTKCADNLAEMEPWYDQWLRTLGCAMIDGPSDCAGQIPDVAVADMSPPLRRPCRRIASRMCILSDGNVVPCEQDVLGRQPIGRVGEQSIRELWQRQVGTVCAAHLEQRWAEQPMCAACREWHRP